jgi:hypothetical protein
MVYTAFCIAFCTGPGINKESANALTQACFNKKKD